MFTVGVITGAHGIKGDVKIFPFSDDITRFEKLKTVYLDVNGGLSQYDIKAVRYHKKYVIIKLEGVEAMDSALALKGAYIKIDDEFALPLSEGEYYVRDLYGMEVYTDTEEYLGQITDVFKTGANDVYEVNNKLLIPAIKQCVLKVDIQNKRLTVRLLEGLL